MIKIFHYLPHNIFLAAIISGAVLAGGRTAQAADMHDHGKGGAPTQIAGPIAEIQLPDGLGSAQSLAIDPAGRIWFTEKVGKKLASYDPEKKHFATYSLPSSWGSVGFSNITSAPDGAIWFTVNRWAEGAEEPCLLGRFTPADGYFTKYAIPNKTVPEELIVDAGGLIWFLATNKNILYRIDPKNFALKGYPIPTANGHPRSLAAAPDGRIWFVESNANKIAEFIPAEGVFHEHDVLTSFANPGRISIGKDGKIWFVELTANRLGAFSPDRKRFDEVIIPTPGSSPVALVNDDGGNIWVLEYKGNKVGAFNPGTAVFREFDIPTYNSLPTEMVIDRKRSLIWFTQSATESKRLGMLSLNEALAENKLLDKTAASKPAEKASAASGTGWLAILSAAAVIVLMAWRIIFRSRKDRHTQA